ncbi:hypothetical protein ACNI65_11385 [Roseateles sp. So40a]|uniref:hypothetical protein n=1 Tax=Roseateles sp. So40a TaxID=3400226 RepID=UPI003A8688D4
MISMPLLGMAGIEPLTTSSALYGYLAQIFPNSDTCSRWMVPDRTEVATRMLAPLWPKRISAVVHFLSVNCSRSDSGRLPYAKLTLSRKITSAASLSWATMPQRIGFLLNSAVSSQRRQTNVVKPS